MAWRSALNPLIALGSKKGDIRKVTAAFVTLAHSKFFQNTPKQPILQTYTANLCTVSSSVKGSVNVKIKNQITLDPEGKIVTITWQDGLKSRFHGVWLRHNCHCSVCQQKHSGQKLIDVASLSPHQVIEDVNINGAVLEIKWKGCHHAGHVPLSHLQDHCYESDTLRMKRDAVEFGPCAEVKHKMAVPATIHHQIMLEAVPQFNYNDLINTSDGLLRWLKQINEDGLSVLKQVPTEDEFMVKKVAERIASVDDLIYGQTWDVFSTPKPINVAYSSVGLDFHMDLIYYESAPGLQFLHCLRFDDCVEGGESLFLDVFHVAEQFRKDHPEKFYTLTQIPATFQKKHYSRDFPVEMKYQKPHIVLNQYKEIVAVNWAPAFEGPLAVEQDQVEPYYKAYTAFAEAIKFSPNILEYLLRPGDLVSFNNRRILHARKDFVLNGGVRHLKGCYLNIDHFKNKVQTLSRLCGTGAPAKRVGNQDWS